MTVHPTLSVANAFIDLSQWEGVPMTPMKLLKLVYIAHGWSLGVFERPLIGEQVQAWEYGAVVPSVFRDFRRWKRGPIESQKAILTERGQFIIPAVYDGDERKLLERVWEQYKDFDGLQLSDLTSRPGTPWDITRRQSNETRPEIPQPLLREHYRELLMR